MNRFGAHQVRFEEPAYESYDVFINNAHIDFEQPRQLMKWFNLWRNDESKLIINISSRAGLPNLSKGYMYAAQKAALDHMADNLVYNTDKKCRITTIGLGMLESNLPSVKYIEVCDLIEYILSMPRHLEIPRVYLQHAHNYKDVQKMKEPLYETMEKET